MAAKVVSHAIAATAGALLGGGVGAVAGAAFAPVLEEMLRRGDGAYADSVYRALEAASETADMSADEMAGAIKVHDRYLALSTTTVQAALNTLNEQKVAGLGRALGDGLRDGALLDVSWLAVRLSVEPSRRHAGK